MATQTTANRSNAVLETSDIELNLSLFEARGNLFDYWHGQVAPSVTGTEEEYLRRNFPRGNPLRMVILERAFSIATPTIRISDGYGEIPGANSKPKGKRRQAAAEDEDESGQEQQDAKRASIEAKREELRVRLQDLLNRTVWEGEKSLWAALPWWRAFALVCGDNFFKLPIAKDADLKESPDPNVKPGQVLPERMRAQWAQILPHPSRQKVVAGYRFEYPIGGIMNTAGVASNWMVEEIKYDTWVRKHPNGTVETQRLTYGFIPAERFSFEEREGNPRGVPLFDRLREKALDVLTAALIRKGGVKRSGGGIQVVKNAEGITSPVPAGGIVNMTDTANKTADFKVVGTEFDDGPAQREYLDAVDELYDEAALPSPRRTAAGAGSDPASGSALAQMSRREVAYAAAFTQTEGPFLQRLISKALRLEGADCKPEDICVEYDLSTGLTQTQRVELARVYFEQGYEEQALITLGHDEESLDEIQAMRSNRRQGQMLDERNLSADAQAAIDRVLQGDAGRVTAEEQARRAAATGAGQGEDEDEGAGA